VIKIEIFKLFGRILVDNKEANKSISKSDNLAQKLGKTLGKGIKTAAKFGAALGAGAVAAGSAIYGLASKASEATDRIDKLSQRLGLSRQGFQEWEFVLSQSGVSIDSLQTGMKTLSQRMGDAAEGTGKGAEAFNKLGISVKDSAGNLKSQEQIFNESITALQEMKDGVEKAALAQDLLSRSGQDLLPLLNGSAENTEKLKQKAEELGLVLSGEAIDAGVNFTDTIDQLKRSFGAVFTQVGTKFIPIMMTMSEWIMGHMPQIQGVVQSVFSVMGMYVGYFSEAISYVSPYIRSMWERGKDYLGRFIEIVNEVRETVVTWVNENQETISHYKQLLQDMWIKAKEILGGLVEFIKIVLITVKDFWEKYGEDIKRIVKTVFEIIETVVRTAMNTIKEIVDVATALFKGDWNEFWNSIKDIFKNIFMAMVDIVPQLLSFLIDAIKLGFNGLKDAGKHIFEGLWEGMKNIWKGISNWVSDKVEWLKDKVTFWKNENDKMTPSGDVPRYANGTTYHPGGMAIVGEQGPELVNLPRGSSVTPNNKLGGVTINVNGANIMDDYGVDRMMDKIIERLAVAGVS
jgi:uncharacterized coiled-coil protein SlyX